MKTALLLICLVFVVGAAATSKIQVGDFTRSPNEHIINEIYEPIVVRSVVGRITLAHEGGGPLPDVLFEIQGPNTDRRIRRCKTDKLGRFKIGHVPDGTYRFKTTLESFQSVMGTIRVTKRAAKNAEMQIEIHVGT